MDNLVLKQKIIERIKTNGKGKIPFSHFMQMVLYEPEQGYYTNRTNLIGARGDFYTAPHLTPVFGQLIAKQFAEMWERLGKPTEFTLMEMGAGQGLLASDVLSWLYTERQDLWASLRYVISEISIPLTEAQSRRINAVPNGHELIKKVSWRKLDDIDNYTLTGCIFSNEFFDALPFDLVTFEQGKVREIYVSVDENDNFIEEIAEPLGNGAEYFFLKGNKLDLSKYPEGYRTEINHSAIDMLNKLRLKLERGYILTLDYGYLTESRYHPRRTQGTLQCFFNHQMHDNPYINIGKQDITAHVDFSELIRLGEGWGLTTLGFTNQATFLAGLGIGDILREVSERDYTGKSGKSPKEVLTEHNALHTLINPTKMGNFGVLIQSKNVENTAPLLGLQYT
jgi:SAM-dependent MidA family methyltransferase